MELKQAVALVTGANRGLGLALTKTLLAVGAKKVYAAARDPRGITLPGAVPLKLDVTDERAIQAAAEACGDVNLLINNAGVALVSGFLADGAIQAAQHDHGRGLDVIVCVEQPDGSYKTAWHSPS